MTRKYFSGDTLAQALSEAARHFEVEPEQLAYRQVDKRHGFLKIRRRFLIEVDPDAPRRTPDERSAPPGRGDREEAAPRRPAASPDEDREARPPREAAVGGDDRGPVPPRETPAGREEGHRQPAEGREAPQGKRERRETEAGDPQAPERPRRRRRGRGRRRGGGSAAREDGRDLVELPEGRTPAEESFPKATGEEAEAAHEALRRIFTLASLEVEAEVLQGDDQLVIELRGRDQELLLDDRGRLLLAIQHLLPRMIRGLIGRSVVCHVDSDNFREIREERLRHLAQRTAEEVRRHGQPETLEPMSPDERRIVHLTLTDDPGVDTRSHGSGLFKRVTVSPTHRRRPRGFDPYRR